MSHKIQITVDDCLNNIIQAKAKQLSLSISSYARLILTNVFTQKNASLLDKAIGDLSLGDTEEITLKAFNEQVNQL